ncbi:helix-turn-helix transcriptional regulator [Clostridium botulinum]|uniref:Transcriptional regulator, AraC family n=1 Tax=Clostridium botulinum (strain Eklund 17B / Type B) TaxID=935198 RepID=B2TKJ7_CLOBB|nr:transcriptional regulator, AraC family [Clostridium botulinum B str. Eklund 17B (NRP)]MBY6976473.1 helix-turn-helix transcriptional regulator [Clostridium botulinum]MBY7001594.1 helix-turn-helix transcriptional regulator [Clostridium botulinum]MCR1274429.1 helix-turn-helix transcriptional regulator [Clostridium botulinum]NFD69108.1 helix-turn-helix transcriptional regulator [Clostridium botulinum]
MTRVLKTKEFRELKNLTVSKLSYKSGVAIGYITELENGKYKNPSLQIICKLSKALNITPNDLIDKNLWN